MSLLNKSNEEYQLLDTAREILRNPIFGVVESITTNNVFKRAIPIISSGSGENHRQKAMKRGAETFINSIGERHNPYKILELEKVNLVFNRNGIPYITIEVKLEDYEYLRNLYIIPYLNNSNVSFELRTSSQLYKCELHHKTQLIIYAGEQFSIDLYRQSKNSSERYIGYIENLKEIGKYKKYIAINNVDYLVMLGESYNEEPSGRSCFDGEFEGFYQYQLLKIDSNLIKNIKFICEDFNYVENFHFLPKKFIIKKKFYDKFKDSFKELMSEMKTKGYKVEITIIDADGLEVKEKQVRVNDEKSQSVNNAKDFIAINPKGRRIEASNITQFAKKNNLNKKSISACLNKRQKTHKKWQFRFVNA